MSTAIYPAVGAGVSNPRTRLRLTRRGRAVLTALVVIPLLSLVVALAATGGQAHASSEAQHASFSTVTVANGDSLWKIAETIAPSADPRDVVSSIVDLNQLADATLVPGQKLAIPAEYASAGAR